MLFNEKSYEFEIDGRKCSFSTGKFARKSHSAVIARMGDTVILATVNIGKANPDAGFFPLTVEYMEKMYAAGLISSSRFVKRDKFPSDDAVLRSRIIDRSIRPRFPKDYLDEVSIIVKVLAYDPDNDPVLLGINAVSAALMISDVPFDGPIAGVRVGLREDVLVPYYKQMDRDNFDESKMNLVLSGDSSGFVNIDSNMYEISEEKIVEGMEMGISLFGEWIKAQEEFAKIVGHEKKGYVSYKTPQELIDEVKSVNAEEVAKKLYDADFGKETDEVLNTLYTKYEGKYAKREVYDAYEQAAKMIVKKLAFEDGKRIDGRGLDDIRELGAEVGVLPRVHGVGLFSRGLTQVLTIATLGTLRRQQTVEDMMGEDVRNYMHYYIETPFVFGEAGRVKYIAGRREVGHGALAEKALYPVLPSIEEFPYTIVLMSEIQSENGSSSMASTCGSTLALMDAGVPIKKPVAGIAMGVIVDDASNVQDFRLLVDMKGEEDFYGYMDFKAAGTRDGVTAIQMDTKARALPVSVFAAALGKSKNARLQILDVMEKAIPESKKEVSVYAPKVATEKIPVDKIGELIGPGGKNIRALSEKTGTELEIEEDGTVHIFAVDKDHLEAAVKIIKGYSMVPQIGEIYDGIVDGVVDFGAFVEIAPGVSGLVHISELSKEFVKDINSVVKVGDQVKIKILDIERGSGKMKFSMKAV